MKRFICKILLWFLKEDFKKIGELQTNFNSLYQYSHGNMKRGIDNKKRIGQLFALYNVSTDIGYHDTHKNWAVINLRGNANYIKFVQLPGNDIYEILRFLKQFEGSNLTIDSPHPRMMTEELMKF